MRFFGRPGSPSILRNISFVFSRRIKQYGETPMGMSWKNISRKSVGPSHPVLVRCCLWTGPDGTPPANSKCPKTSSRSPELNPVENIWQFMRDNWLSNRIFEDYEAIVDACCDAWMRLMERPWKIMSIGLREWALAG